MRWRKGFPFRWLRKKRSAVSDVCGSDSSQYNVVPLTLTLSHQGRGDLLGEVNYMNTLPLDGGGEALNHVRFRTVMHPTWCMGWGWMEDMIEHVKADD